MHCRRWRGAVASWGPSLPSWFIKDSNFKSRAGYNGARTVTSFIYAGWKELETHQCALPAVAWRGGGGKSGVFPSFIRFINEIDFKSRAGYNGARTVTSFIYAGWKELETYQCALPAVAWRGAVAAASRGLSLPSPPKQVSSASKSYLVQYCSFSKWLLWPKL